MSRAGTARSMVTRWSRALYLTCSDWALATLTVGALLGVVALNCKMVPSALPLPSFPRVAVLHHDHVWQIATGNAIGNACVQAAG